MPEWRHDFQKKMYDGYEQALKKKSPVTFTFRGVETTIHPDQQEVDDQLIDIRIKDVLKELRKVSNVSKVIFNYAYITDYWNLRFFSEIQSSCNSKNVFSRHPEKES